jgi:hypothetical protein
MVRTLLKGRKFKKRLQIGIKPLSSRHSVVNRIYGASIEELWIQEYNSPLCPTASAAEIEDLRTFGFGLGD